MKKYIVKKFPAGTDGKEINWNVIPVARIDTYKWLDGYTPEAAAQLVYVEGEGFILRMTCAEKNPLRRYRQYNEPVYTDSCLEFFADYVGSGAYVNMEMNAGGTLLSCIGEGRGNRTPIKDICHGAIFPTVGSIHKDRWAVTATVSLPMLADLYGTDIATLTEKFISGYTFHGNFYKCGDETAVPHYGMWNPVGTENADFHRPEYFGALVIE